MRLIYSKHARDRMAERGITESDILACLGDHFSRIVGSRAGKQSVTYMGYVGGRTLKVVIAVDRDGDTEKFVITTVWRGDDGS